MGRLRRPVLGLAVAVVLLGVVPAALVHLGGPPIPGRVGEELALGATGWAWLAAWLGWAIAGAAAARDLGRALSHDPLVRARAGLVGGALAALITFASPAGASSGHATAGARAAVVQAADQGLAPSTAEHVVAAGESLWSIAEARLGDGRAWGAIWSLNAGADMGAGQRLVDPSLILPGWTLRLPVELAPPARSSTPASPPGGEAPRTEQASSASPGLGTVNPVRAVRSTRWLPGSLAAGGGSVLVLLLLGSWLARRRRGLGDEVAAAWAALDDPLLDQLEELDQLRAAPMVDRVANAWAAVVELGLDRDVLAIGVGNAGCQALVEAGRGRRVLQLPEAVGAAELPPLLCLGDDGEASWVAPLLPGRVVAFEGPGARQVLRASTAQLSWWPWTEDLVVTADRALADRELRLRGAGAVVYTGDPATLEAGDLASLAVVTTAETSGRSGVLRCELHAAGFAVAGLDLARPDPSPELVAHAVDLDAVAAPTLRPAPGPSGGPRVRLLTLRPRIEGLEAELPAARERKATELVAYLALHAPAEVPGDRLRARLLGRRDGDGTAKTLANIASVARGGLGGGHLPPAGVDAAYRVVGVDTDLALMAELVAEGEASLDGTRRVALLREALRLVEGEPGRSASGGYQWWRSEGHAARAGALATSAAWSLVDDAIGEGSVALASWGIGQARLLEPESESLLRAEMVLAGIADDPDALREAWARCCDLDGGVPSAAAERTFETVSARLRARRP